MKNFVLEMIVWSVAGFGLGALSGALVSLAAWLILCAAYLSVVAIGWRAVRGVVAFCSAFGIIAALAVGIIENA